MGVITSQHGEDTTIDALLGHPDKGFYIDVGAHHFSRDSVTKYFYDRGWSGINIEPLTRYYDLLVKHRIRDINLNVACGKEVGTLTLWDCDGLTSAIRAADGNAKQVEVPMTTLANICDEYVKDKTIDFLKIDVELAERDVILGANWEKYRPKVLCIESSYPMTTIEQQDVSSEWIDLIFDAGYEFVTQDVVNKYFKIKD